MNNFIELLKRLNNGEQFSSNKVELEYEKEKQLIDLLYAIDNFPLDNSDKHISIDNIYEHIYCFTDSKRKHFNKYHIQDIANLVIDYTNKPNIVIDSKKISETIIEYANSQDGKPFDSIVYDYASRKRCKDSKKIKDVIFKNATKKESLSDEILTEEILKYATNDKFCKDIASIIIERKRFSSLNKEIQEVIKESTLPRRDDEMYQIISSYEPYELTHCISYEMAIRNKDVQTILEKIKTLTLLSRDFIRADIQHKNDSALFYILEMEEQIEKILESLDTLKIKLNIDFNTSNLTEIQNELFRLIVEYTVLLEEDYYMIYDRKEIVPEGMEEAFKEPNHYEPDRELNQYMDKAIEESIKSTYDPSPRYKDNYAVKDGYVTYQASYKDSNKYDINKIFPNFKRPMREFNQTQVAFNMSLPKDEIVKYIEKIKDDYDNKNNSYKTLNQLLFGEDTDSRVDERLEHKQKERYADDFFIFDYYSQSPEKHEKKLEIIQHKLSQYHGMKVENGRNDYEYISYDEGQMEDIPKQNYPSSDFASLLEKAKNYRTIIHHLSIDVIQERYEKMKDIIDKQRYKALINQFI